MVVVAGSGEVVDLSHDLLARREGDDGHACCVHVHRKVGQQFAHELNLFFEVHAAHAGGAVY